MNLSIVRFRRKEFEGISYGLRGNAGAEKFEQVYYKIIFSELMRERDNSTSG